MNTSWNKKQYKKRRIDSILLEIDRARLTLLPGSTHAQRQPSQRSHVDTAEPENLSQQAKLKSSKLLRVNHAGEVCAQALYYGQASQAQDSKNKQYLLNAAQEEADHLSWCETRLQELQQRTSTFNPVWYFCSFILGAAIARLGDNISLGFIHATEEQVSIHLKEHLNKLPNKDKKSRIILEKMLEDEQHHAHTALERGGKIFPTWIQKLMKLNSKVMTTLSYHI